MTPRSRHPGAGATGIAARCAVAALGLLLAAGRAPARAQETASRTLLTVDHHLDWERVVDPLDPSIWPDHSPLMHVARVQTPTLLRTGDLDLRTPIGQTEEYYQALRAHGVPTAMIRFSGEYHGSGSRPSNFMRTQLYLLSWFTRRPAPDGSPALPATPRPAAPAAN